ncbi:monovalent cation/H(+) antiporter subunit G [Nocardioides bruguierae]|uniref:Monovalent cation/H(+) antiporter subunit G n=1 Tax=Nocardioides bruguierae TaxID=2945102 RepID=A0A9X2IGF0_9ACTN|nr:monovalent cation/H(+) antiporter subunit G [Nocardioides bruguierae]MCL8027440.1 monovalent cation/H(+) antiporter subunit G [Nocardioides bruguierae]MCM0620710.1 monovalent cation/H(+) antiporter subunit G [Nocardioides bruguierae]
MNGPLEIVGGVLLLLGSLFFLLSAIGMLRSGDAISRINNLSPATGLGLPLVIIGVTVQSFGHGSTGWMKIVFAVLSVVAALVVSSVGSNVLARAAYRSQDVLDPRTVGNALGDFEDLGEPQDPDEHPDHRRHQHAHPHE